MGAFVGTYQLLIGGYWGFGCSNVDGYLIPATDLDLYPAEMLMNDRTFGNRDPARDPGFFDAG